jgi:hypothetical protein
MKTQSPERDKFTLELVNPILFVLSLIPFGGVLVYMFCFFRDMIFRNQGFQESMFSGMQNSIEILSFAIILLSLLTPSSYALPFLKNPPKPRYWLIGSIVISIWALICWTVVGIII